MAREAETELMALSIEKEMRQSLSSKTGGPMRVTAAHVQRKETHAPHALSDSGSKMPDDGNTDSETGYDTNAGINQLHHLNWKGTRKTQSRFELDDLSKGQRSKTPMTFMCTQCPHIDDSKASELVVQTTRHITEMKNIAFKIPTLSPEHGVYSGVYEMVGGTPYVRQQVQISVVVRHLPEMLRHGLLNPIYDLPRIYRSGTLFTRHNQRTCVIKQSYCSYV